MSHKEKIMGIIRANDQQSYSLGFFILPSLKYDKVAEEIETYINQLEIENKEQGE